jgi:hypothetical protein
MRFLAKRVARWRISCVDQWIFEDERHATLFVLRIVFGGRNGVSVNSARSHHDEGSMTSETMTAPPCQERVSL